MSLEFNNLLYQCYGNRMNLLKFVSLLALVFVFVDDTYASCGRLKPGRLAEKPLFFIDVILPSDMETVASFREAVDVRAKYSEEFKKMVWRPPLVRLLREAELNLFKTSAFFEILTKGSQKTDECGHTYEQIQKTYIKIVDEIDDLLSKHGELREEVQRWVIFDPIEDLKDILAETYENSDLFMSVMGFAHSKAIEKPMDFIRKRTRPLKLRTTIELLEIID